MRERNNYSSRKNPYNIEYGIKTTATAFFRNNAASEWINGENPKFHHLPAERDSDYCNHQNKPGNEIFNCHT